MTDRAFPRKPSSPTPLRRRLVLLTAALVAGTALLPPGVAAAAPLRTDSWEASARALGGGATIVP
ncbi:hypothetical protein, partial [Streptomyces prunicolor]